MFNVSVQPNDVCVLSVSICACTPAHWHCSESAQQLQPCENNTHHLFSTECLCACVFRVLQGHMLLSLCWSGGKLFEFMFCMLYVRIISWCDSKISNGRGNSDNYTHKKGGMHTHTRLNSEEYLIRTMLICSVLGWHLHWCVTDKRC